MHGLSRAWLPKTFFNVLLDFTTFGMTDKLIIFSSFTLLILNVVFLEIMMVVPLKYGYFKHTSHKMIPLDVKHLIPSCGASVYITSLLS